MRSSARCDIKGTNRTTPRVGRPRGEAGDTLVEVLLALIVLGMASVALLIAFGTSISASADHRQLSASGVALDSISQQVIADVQATPSLFTCPSTYANMTNYQVAVSYFATPFTVPTGFTVAFATPAGFSYPVQYWSTSNNAFGNACEAGQPQQITLTVTDTANRQTFTNSFVVDTPLSSGTVAGGAGATYGAASFLTFSTAPVGGSTGQQLQTQPVITVEDNSNPRQIVVDDLSPVLLTLTGSSSTNYAAVTNGATLTGCAGSETGGVISFTGCSVSVAGTYSIAATDGDFAGTFQSPDFTVAASADYLVFHTLPVAGLSGALMTREPVVEAYNSQGFDVNWSGTVTLTASGGSLTNCSSMTVTAGVGTAAFTSCKFAGAYYYNPISGVYLATPYTLTATATGSATPTSPATSSAFGVAGPGAASQLIFSQEPTGAEVGNGTNTYTSTPFASQPVVTVEDSFGNIVTSSTASISLSMNGSSSNGGSLSCNANPVSSSGGSATFSGCAASTYGTNLALTAASTGLSSATSTTFNVTGVPSQLIFTTQPVAGVSGAAFVTQPTVTVRDQAGMTVTASSTPITLTSYLSGVSPVTTGGSLQLCTNLAPYLGVVNVATCDFAGVVGTGYYLTATQGSLVSGPSGVFSPTGAGVPTKLVFTQEPTGPLAAGSTLQVQPIIDVEDSGGNVTTSNETITLTASGGVLSGCTNLTAVQGVIDVGGCMFGGLDASTPGYTLTASSATGQQSLADATSSSFYPLGPGPASSTVSTVAASPAIVVDNGTASATVTVTLKDVYTNVIPGKSINLGQGSTSSVISPDPVVTGSNGVAAFTVTDTNRQIVTYVANDASDSTVLAAQAQVSFATQLTPPTAVTLSYGTTSGSLGVTFTGSTNAPAGQTYTAVACTDTAMSTGCVGPTTVLSTSTNQLTGLAWTQGAAGTPYYVTVTASASSGYLASTSTYVGPQNATSQVNAPTGLVVASSTTTAGDITATFTNSTGLGVGSYTATVCTNTAMNIGCTTHTSYTSGVQIASLTPGTTYYVTITAVPSTSAYLSATTAASSGVSASVQLPAPTGVTLTPGTTAGSLTVSFTGSSGAPGGQLYTALACTNTAMNTGCVGPQSITSGGQFTGLVGGTSYYVTVSASASPGYLASVASTYGGPKASTTQLANPTAVTLSYGTTAGSIGVSFTAPTNAASGQTYTAVACTDTAMSTGCVGPTTVLSTSTNQLTGLAWTQGAAGTPYYVTVTASASSGYLASTSTYVGPQNATSQVNAPTGLVVASSTTTAGDITATFTNSTGLGVGSYTATVCTNTAMNIGCTTHTSYTSGVQIASLTPGTTYYVTITAVPSTSAYLSATTTFGAANATIAMSPPTAVTLSYGAAAGSIGVNFTVPTGSIASGQTYSALACTNTAMNAGCVSDASITSGAQFTGLAWTQGAAGTPYYVTVTANASSGYLASTSTYAGPQNATSQVNAPTGLTTAPSTTNAGDITATFTNSTGTAPSSYTATVCTNPAMSTGCVTNTSYISGSQIGSLTPGTPYYVTITAVAPNTAFVSAVTAISSATPAAIQLGPPTITSLAANGSSTTSFLVNFTAGSPVAPGQIYSALACTNSNMTGTCVSQSSITPGGAFSGLSSTLSYYVTVTATASNGYLASTSSYAGPRRP
jgi:type II secretory pathway pseudopilin PulG